jgi:hypothetical protein
MTYLDGVSVPHTIVETPVFIRQAASCMSDAERMAAIDMVASDPECGDLIQGTGGIRKVRFAIGAKGKSGGVRIMYFFKGPQIPIFMLTVFAKSSKANLTPKQRNALAKVAKAIADEYRKRQE